VPVSPVLPSTNSGTLWALGRSSLTANLTNNGSLWATSLNGTSAKLTVSGNYAGGTGSAMYVDYASLAQGGAAILSITGNATGSTNVVMSDPQSLAGVSLSNLARNAVVTVNGTVANGASNFTMNQSYGLVTMGLDYSAATQTWSINYSTAKTGNMLDKLPQAGAQLVTSVFDIGADRLDILRTEVLGGGGGSVPLGYAAEATDPISSALAKAPSRVRHGAWTSVIGNVGHGDGYNRDSATLQAGLDGGKALDNGDFVTLGIMAGYNATKFRFDETYTMSFTGPSIAGYGELTFTNGQFVTADIGWQRLNANIEFAGLTSTSEGISFGGKLTGGYRLLAHGFELTPSASVGVNRTKIGDFTMQGLAVNFGTSNTLSGEAMLKVARPMIAEFGWITPFGSVKVGDRKTSGGGVSVSDSGTYTGDSTGLFGASTLGFSVSDRDGRARRGSPERIAATAAKTASNCGPAPAWCSRREYDRDGNEEVIAGRLAPGTGRIVMLLAGEDNLREVGLFTEPEGRGPDDGAPGRGDAEAAHGIEHPDRPAEEVGRLIEVR